MVLKQDHPDGSTSYRDLGSEYILIVKETSPERFKEAGLTFFGNGDTHFTGKCFALVVYNSGSVIYPLYIGFGYQIMNNDGGLFYDIGYHHGLVNLGNSEPLKISATEIINDLKEALRRVIKEVKTMEGHEDHWNLMSVIEHAEKYLEEKEVNTDNLHPVFEEALGPFLKS